MNATRSRLVTVLASAILTVLLRVGVAEITPELVEHVHAWVAHTLDLLLYIGFTALRSRLVRGGGERLPRPCQRGEHDAPAPLHSRVCERCGCLRS